MSDDWGPWVEHDGKGMPDHIVGVPCECYFLHSGADLTPGSAGPDGDSWHWMVRHGVPECFGVADPIIRYRIRKPRGMKVLENILAELPNTPEKVGA